MENRGWVGEVPMRKDLIVNGYAFGELACTYKNKRGKMVNKGIYADKIPDKSGNGLCPAVEMKSVESCSLYQEQEAKRKRNNKGSNRIDVSPEVKRWVARRDKYYCYYCDKHITKLKEMGLRGNIDHIVPQSKGGSNADSNLCYSCSACNNEKGVEIWSKGCKSRK